MTADSNPPRSVFPLSIDTYLLATLNILPVRREFCNVGGRQDTTTTVTSKASSRWRSSLRLVTGRETGSIAGFDEAVNKAQEGLPLRVQRLYQRQRNPETRGKMGQGASSEPDDAVNETALTTTTGVDATIHFRYLTPELRQEIDAWCRDRGWLTVAIGAGCVAVAIGIKAVGRNVNLGPTIDSLALKAASWGGELVRSGVNSVNGGNARIAN